MNPGPSRNIDTAEVAHFDSVAAHWWDPAGEMRALHELNPLRLGFIQRNAGLAGKTVIDIGCGGGILSEAMAASGAAVTGVDAAEGPLTVARLHGKESGIKIDYQQGTAEEMAAVHPERFDIVTCMELLEHVPDPTSVVSACARLARPGGDVFFSTINRNLKSFMLAIVGAEYLLGLLARGTHRYEKFIRPSELDRWAGQAGLQIRNLTGIHYNPLTRNFTLGDNVDVNYLAHYHAPRQDPAN